MFLHVKQAGISLQPGQTSQLTDSVCRATSTGAKVSPHR